MTYAPDYMYCIMFQRWTKSVFDLYYVMINQRILNQPIYILLQHIHAQKQVKHTTKSGLHKIVTQSSDSQPSLRNGEGA